MMLGFRKRLYIYLYLSQCTYLVLSHMFSLPFYLLRNLSSMHNFPMTLSFSEKVKCPRYEIKMQSYDHKTFEFTRIVQWLLNIYSEHILSRESLAQYCFLGEYVGRALSSILH